jgi:hypothetical protein
MGGLGRRDAGKFFVMADFPPPAQALEAVAGKPNRRCISALQHFLASLVLHEAD